MKTIKRLGYMLFHPFAGFGDCIEHRRFPLGHVFVILAAFFAGSILEYLATGFLFNYNNPDTLNILLIFGKTVVLFFLWCAANWAITTLFEGKGTFRQIMYTSAIALVPHVTALFLRTALSNLLILNEQAFLVIIQWIGLVFSGFVLLAALMTIHDYSLKQAVLSCITSILFIVIVLFLAVIIFSLFQQAYSFFNDVYNELSFML